MMEKPTIKEKGREITPLPFASAAF
jgi:hypothetical protein